MDLEAVVRDLERRVGELEEHAQRPRRILRGWREIEAYTRLSRRQLSSYRTNEGAPIMRWGRHVVMVPETLGTWLCAREPHQVRRARKRVREQPPLP